MVRACPSSGPSSPTRETLFCWSTTRWTTNRSSTTSGASTSSSGRRHTPAFPTCPQRHSEAAADSQAHKQAWGSWSSTHCAFSQRAWILRKLAQGKIHWQWWSQGVLFYGRRHFEEDKGIFILGCDTSCAFPDCKEEFHMYTVNLAVKIQHLLSRNTTMVEWTLQHLQCTYLTNLQQMCDMAPTPLLTPF